MNRTFDGRLERLEQRTNRSSERLRIIRVIVDENGKVIERLERSRPTIASRLRRCGLVVMTTGGYRQRIEKLEATNSLDQPPIVIWNDGSKDTKQRFVIWSLLAEEYFSLDGNARADRNNAEL